MQNGTHEETDDTGGGARAYLARIGIGTYVYDVLRLLALHGVGENSNGEGGGGGRRKARLAFAAKYFAALATGNHILGRSYEFIVSTTFNMTCFAVRYAAVLAGMSDNSRAGVPLSCALCRSAARLVCPDFPARIVRISWRLMLLLHDGEASATTFARAMHAVMLHDRLIRGCGLKNGGTSSTRRTLSTAILAECAVIKLAMCVDDAREMAERAIIDVVTSLPRPSSSESASGSASTSSSSSSSSSSSAGTGTADDDVSGEVEDDACSTDEAVLARFIQRRIEDLSETGKVHGDPLHLDDMDFVTSLIDANAAKLLSSSSLARPASSDRNDGDEQPRHKKTSPSQPATAHAFATKSENAPMRSKSSRAAMKSSAAAADVPTPIRRRGYSNNTIVVRKTTRPVSAPPRKPSM